MKGSGEGRKAGREKEREASLSLHTLGDTIDGVRVFVTSQEKSFRSVTAICWTSPEDTRCNEDRCIHMYIYIWRCACMCACVYCNK